MVDASGMIEGEDVLNGSKELLADKIKNCYSSNDYVIMELLNNDTIILVDCNNNFKYSKFDNLKSTGIDYSKFNHMSIGWMNDLKIPHRSIMTESGNMKQTYHILKILKMQFYLTMSMYWKLKQIKWKTI